MNNSDITTAKIDNERLFGKSVDIFKNYYACLGIYNILKTIGVETSADSDWFRAVAKYLTTAELSAMYDKILSRDVRNSLASSRNHRTPPEISEDDPDDIISYLAKNLVSRRKMWRICTKIYEKRVEEYKEALKAPGREKSAVEVRFEEMKELFSLSSLEFQALVAIFIAETRFVEYGDFDVNHFRNSEKVSSLARTLGILDVEAAELLDDKNNIRKFNLVDNDLDIDRTFLSYLAGISSKPLAERFWTRYTGEILPWEFHGKLAAEKGEVLKKMISAKGEDEGLSILLYGVPGSGKTSYAASLAQALGKELYFIAQNDDDNRRMSYSANFRYAALAVAQKQLPPNSLLVVDECDKLVENTGIAGGFFSRIFGGDPAGSRDGESKGQLNTVLDNNRHTIIWICNSKSYGIDPSSRRRFDFNIFFDELSETSRGFVWKNLLKYYGCEGKLSENTIQKLSARYHVNPGGVAVAVKNAASVTKKNPELDFGDQVLIFLKAHCQLLGVSESPTELLEPARDYSLEGLNIKSGIKLHRLIDVCKTYLKTVNGVNDEVRDQPRLNLLLFGCPGSGKTEFVKYLAQQLGQKLCIKNCGDLLNMYVGGTEERITAAFAEAEMNKEILFLDEADGLLSSREGAQRSWEVSQVNTLLAEMERFRGIFICSTNLVQRLDAAAIRRFSFRLNFDYLENEGKETFFSTYFKPLGLPELTESEKKALHAIDQLTPSDFRNTRQQFFYLQDAELTNQEVIEALAAEVASRTCGSNYKGLGSIVNKMGF